MEVKYLHSTKNVGDYFENLLTIIRKKGGVLLILCPVLYRKDTTVHYNKQETDLLKNYFYSAYK